MCDKSLDFLRVKYLLLRNKLLKQYINEPIFQDKLISNIISRGLGAIFPVFHGDHKPNSALALSIIEVDILNTLEHEFDHLLIRHVGGAK